jgi:lipopolysaccharide/colanic/teichoic acid biosynthesis glycosyltransferase
VATRVSTALGEAPPRAICVEAEAAVPAISRKARRWPDSTPPPSLLRRPLGAVVAEIEVVQRPRTARALKRTVDVVGSAVGLAMFAPIFVVVAILVRVTSKGPAFFVQERCGVGGRVFRFYKFRTMVLDAEQRKAELQHLNEMRGPVFKIQRDPRVTAVGRVLRKSSLDELPQLWNVLRGEMSLVGPRPPTPDEVECYDARAAQRLSVMPGITGLWQVSGRSSLADFDKWVDLDLEYTRRASFLYDLKTLAKTAYVVVRARGAQ